jgi:hypothetical protein
MGSSEPPPPPTVPPLDPPPLFPQVPVRTPQPETVTILAVIAASLPVPATDSINIVMYPTIVTV